MSTKLEEIILGLEQRLRELEQNQRLRVVSPFVTNSLNQEFGAARRININDTYYIDADGSAHLKGLTLGEELLEHKIEDHINYDEYCCGTGGFMVYNVLTQMWTNWQPFRAYPGTQSTLVDWFNADLLDGKHAADFALLTDLATKQPLDADLTSIAGLAGTSGLLRKTAENTWGLDTNVYLTENQTITLSGIVTGSGATAITTAIADGALSIAKTNGLQAALNLKWDASNDGSGSGLDADLLDGYHGSNFLGKNGTSYYQADNWIQFASAYGLYFPNSGAGTHFQPNDTQTYGSFSIWGAKNDYQGFHFYNTYNNLTLMVRTTDGLGGMYYQATATWQWLYDPSISNIKIIGQYPVWHSGNLTGFREEHKHNYLWSTSHPNDYYLTNDWRSVNGTYRWRIISNHGDNCSVAHADLAANSELLGGHPWSDITAITGSLTVNFIPFYNGSYVLSNSLLQHMSGGAKLGTVDTGTPTATPTKLIFDRTYSNGYTKDSLKIALYEGATGDKYGFTIGGVGDIQYHSDGRHDFYYNNAKVASFNSKGINLGNLSGSATNQGDNWITWGVETDPYYCIRTNYKTYGSYTYSRLQIGWHTGIEIGAASLYGGIRFYNNSPFTGSQYVSFFDGDNDVRFSASSHSHVNVYFGESAGSFGVTNGYGLLSVKNSWGNGYNYPTLSSNGTPALVMIDNPHVGYRTDNKHTSQTGMAGIRYAAAANGATWWETGVSVPSSDPNNFYWHTAYCNGTSLIDLFNINTSGDIGIGRNIAISTSHLSTHANYRTIRFGNSGIIMGQVAGLPSTYGSMWLSHNSYYHTDSTWKALYDGIGVVFGLSDTGLNIDFAGSATAGNTHSFYTRFTVDSYGNVYAGRNISGATITPCCIDTGLTYSSNTQNSALKFKLYTGYGFTVGSNSDVQYHSGSDMTGKHDFYINNTRVLRLCNAGGDGIIMSGDNATINRIYCNANTDSQLVVSANGTLTLTGGNELQIAGTNGIHIWSNFYFDSIPGASGGGYVLRMQSGDGMVYKDTSSIRYKENIRYGVNTDWIYNLKVCQYDRKDKSTKDEIGIIAEELAEIKPEFAIKDSKGQIDSYNKLDLIPVLINEIQRLKIEIDLLKGNKK